MGTDKRNDNSELMDFDSSFYGFKTLANRQSKRHFDELQGEFRKIKPRSFNGEFEEVVEAWLLDIKRYF